jgi:hypothetical protein
MAQALIPKSTGRSGLPGPGETTTPLNRSSSISDQSASLRTTMGGRPFTSPSSW